MRTATVAQLTTLTYRQLDYLTRTRLTHTCPDLVYPGAGNAREWPPSLVRRLMIAAEVIRNHPQLGLPDVVDDVLAGPEPPPAAWYVATAGRVRVVTYTLDPAPIVSALLPGCSLVVLRYDLAALVTERAPEEAEEILGSCWAVPAGV